MSKPINYKEEAEKLANALNNLIEMIEPRVDNTTPIDGAVYASAYDVLTKSRVFEEMELPKVRALEPRTDKYADYTIYSWVAKGHYTLDRIVQAINKQFNARLHSFDYGSILRLGYVESRQPGKAFSEGPVSIIKGSRTLVTYTVSKDI